MGRFVLRYTLIPILILWACLTETGIAAAADGENAANLTAGFCLAIPTLIMAWLGIRFSRWLHARFHWDSIPYLLANTVVAIGIVGISVSLSIAMIDSQAEEATTQDIVAILLFLAGFLAGIGWFVRSLWKLASNRNQIFEGIHWRLIAPQSTATRFVQSDMPVGLLVQSKSGKTKMPADKPKRRDKSPSSIFRSVTVGDTRSEDVRGVPIPKRIAPPAPHQTSRQRVSTSSRRDADVFVPSLQVSISYSSPRSSFVEQAKKHVNRTGQKVEHVPFMQYWPTYDSMSDAQQRWYFYWRTQLRQGVALPSDTSYLFVYIYEVLNLVGFSSPEAAFKHLIKFWKHYRVLQPKLDNYLIDWLADFVVVYKLPTTPLKWYGAALQEGAFGGDIDLSVEAWLETGGDFQKLPSNLLYKLASYMPTRSKFFKTHGDEHHLEDAYRQGLQAIEQSLRGAGNSLFKIYRPSQTRVIQREPFASALHGLPRQTITLGRVHPWLSREDLSTTLASIIKYSENIKRDQSGFSSKLRGIELPEEWQKVLDSTFVIAEPRREITIDMDKVAQLQQESEEVRERLLAEGKTGLSMEQETTSKPEAVETAEQSRREIVIDMSEVSRLQDESENTRTRLGTDDQSLIFQAESHEPDQQAEIAGSSTQPSYIQRPADAPADLLTDLPEVAEIIGKAGQTASRILSFLKDNNWEVIPGSIPDVLFEGSFLNTELDTINDRAARVLGDALIFEENARLVVAEDYRDEIEFILNHPDYAETSRADSVPADSAQRYSDLTEDWAAFAQKMQPHHWEALAALIGGVEVEVRLSAIARSAFTTPHQLVDEINEVALDGIGDIVVDTESDIPQIEDEDIEGINALLAWASQKVLLEGQNEY
ncbi:TerB N-terminal domain-containing protein [Patescibacteria group bacterium]|nr:TerB N-terminal domain-containing protein [Patescibacteria group bacterium]